MNYQAKPTNGGTRNDSSVRPMTGNEALARGAWEAGVKVGAAYPGTPSTEILENLARHPEEDVAAEWAINEKVSCDIAIGASFAGVRAVTAMKHVGVNVAADTIMSQTYIGVNGGFVIIVCDDPGIHSSQNEQDTRHYSRFAMIPCLEPTDAQEALEKSKDNERSPVRCISQEIESLRNPGDRRNSPSRKKLRPNRRAAEPTCDSPHRSPPRPQPGRRGFESLRHAGRAAPFREAHHAAHPRRHRSVACRLVFPLFATPLDRTDVVRQA